MAQTPILSTDAVGTAFAKVNTNFNDVYAIHQRTATLAANVATLAANNVAYVHVTPATAVVNSFHLNANLSNYLTTSGVHNAILSRTSNNTSYVGVTPAASVVNSALLNATLANYTTLGVVYNAILSRTSNNTNYVGSTPAYLVVNSSQLSASISSFVTQAQVDDRIRNRTSNSTFFVGTTPAEYVVNTAYLSSTLNYYATNGYLQSTFTNNSTLSTYFGYHQTTAGLSANVAKLVANNSLYLGGIAANQYVNTTGNYVLSGTFAFTNNVEFSKGIYADGGYGTSGQVLTSSGVGGNVRWTTITAGGGGSVTSITTSNGINGGTITGTGTISIRANTGIVANAVGIFVNAAYINSISANSAAFLGSIAASGYQTTAGLAANVAALIANNVAYVGVTPANAVVNSATLTANISTLTTTRLNPRMIGNASINNTAPTHHLSVTGVTYLGGNVSITQGIEDSTGSYGTSGAILSSNGSSNVYWQHLSSYTGTVNAANYVTGQGYGTATATGGAVVNTTHIAIGNSSQNVAITSAGLLVNGATVTPGGGYYKGNKGVAGSISAITNIFRINANTISNNITIAAGENAQATGPIVIDTGFNLLIQTGGRAVII